MGLNLEPARTRSQLWILWLCWLVGGCGESPEPTTTWEHSDLGLYNAVISYDARFAAVSGAAGTSSYWDLEANRKLYVWRHTEGGNSEITHIAFAPNNSHVITAGARDFVVWDANTGAPLGYWAVDGDINDIAISNDARFVLLARILHECR